MEQWEYWTAEIQENENRAQVMQQALAEGGRHGYELVAVTPIVASAWSEQLMNVMGSSSSWRVGTAVLVLTFKRKVGAQPSM